ncbi:pectate lyase superfamily protein-domain-containing protein [Kockovaella imperatae]|uniref:Pectate lyase superfamily protein-domain-containing protein n=1 Tax=Kockovaella imperatae TaxID=4999 RepID=A0A1Y1UJS6_9TREE|nr:pectate lyase superfamily protein-domain-containing protein [Kockovaella imperatae]ORX38303.1 pectate lyase superfamily protein-domain-containing protein [Kockovaella imperatae]
MNRLIGHSGALLLTQLIALAAAFDLSGLAGSIESETFNLTHDISQLVPSGEASVLYPPYNYVPSVDGKYLPSPHGSAFQTPWSFPPGFPFSLIPGGNLLPTLPGLFPANPSGFWYENIQHNGESPFIPDGSNWTVYRNVKDFGAQGDGQTDDTAAIISAINFQDRGPGGNGKGTTGAPAVIYFPTGSYLISNSLPMYVDTIFMGNPIDRPGIVAASNFTNTTMITGFDPAFDAPTNFYMSVKNLILDSTQFDGSTELLLLDWGVSQATQLTNVLFRMPQGSEHTGVSTVQGGSGTFMGNLEFNGGLVGINMNNQQYNVKDVKFVGCQTAILISHGFDLVFQGMNFESCQLGINATTGGMGNVGSVALIDSTATDVPTVLVTKSQVDPSTKTTTGDDSIVIDNLVVNNVDVTVMAGSDTILTGSVPNVWVYGNAYVANGPVGGQHDNGVTYVPNANPSLRPNGQYFTMAPPTYQEYALNQVINIKSVSGYPVYGDGQSDDTVNINAILKRNAGCAVTFFPAGTYIVTSTIHIPPGSRIVGEAWSAISAWGSFFNDETDPQPMVQVGEPGDVGVAQISEVLFTVADILPGCILLEVNMAGHQPGDVGTWNTHFRVGGAAGSIVETGCGNENAPCQAAFMLMHLRPTASIYIEDMWGWTADHDLDGTNNQVISTGRGALIESQNPTWLVGTAFEHNTLYQYNLVNAQNLYTGMQQCETPYWQGVGSPELAPAPWTPNATYNDPTFSVCGANDANCRMAWYQRVTGGSNINLYGSGFWTFFNHNGACQGIEGTCQDNAVEIIGSPQGLDWWNLNTRGVLNVVIDDGEVLATQNNNPGSWGAVVAAILTHATGLAARRRRRWVPPHGYRGRVNRARF